VSLQRRQGLRGTERWALLHHQLWQQAIWGMIMILVSVLAMATAPAPPALVPLEMINSHPENYENQVVMTCGRSFGEAELIVENYFIGRSLASVRLDRVLSAGRACIEAEVVRATPRPPRPGPTVSHPNMIPEDWALKIISVHPALTAP